MGTSQKVEGGGETGPAQEGLPERCVFLKRGPEVRGGGKCKEGGEVAKLKSCQFRMGGTTDGSSCENTWQTFWSEAKGRGKKR